MNQIYFYDTDNIPNHQSRRFGRCSEQLAIRWSLPAFSKKKAASGRPPGHGNRKMNRSSKQSVLPFHHTTPACAAQAEKGSSRNPYFI